ncbi:MAG: TadE family protein [Pirellulales bacterium]
MSRKRIHSNRRGAAAVEFAMTAGLAFFFFFAALEFCRVSMMRHTVQNALYEGARMGIVPGATASDVENKAQSILSSIGVRDAQIDVTPDPILIDSPEVTVRIQMALDRNLYAPSFFFKGLNLDRSYSMRREVPN